MERLAFEFACRSVLIAAAAAAVIGALRIRSAAAQHAVWTCVLGMILVLPLWIGWGPKASVAIRPAAQVVPAELAAPSPLSVAAPATMSQSPAPTRPEWTWHDAATVVYGAGALFLLLRLALGTVRAKRLTGASCSAPITVGIFRPRVLLPATAVDWPAAQLEAVLAHEGAHVRRRDTLVQWFALFNRALFWPHPLAWWLERRLSALAEEACDAEVLARGHSAAEYSSYLLELARAVQTAGGRVDVAGMAMPGAHLQTRIRRMLAGTIVTAVPRPRIAAALAACAVCGTGIAAIGFDAAPQEFPKIPTVRPSFEVASIRPCKNSDITAGGKKGGRGGGRVRGSGGTLVVECRTVAEMVRIAYLDNPEGKPWPAVPGIGIPQPPVSRRVRQQEIQAPGWVGSDRYTIEAKADGTPAVEMMRGPMLQKLLEDRFHLRIRIEERETPVYVLTVASGGPKLLPSKEGSCISLMEFEDRYPGPRKPGEQRPRVCGPFGPTALQRNPNMDRAAAERSIGLETYGQTMAALCLQLTVSTDRDVLDRTGLTGKYDMHLELASQDLFPSAPRPDDPEPPPSDAERVSHIAAALQKLGLKLEAGKAPAPFVVIDHVERPTAN